jgi:hypothetical protein
VRTGYRTADESFLAGIRSMDDTLVVFALAVLAALLFTTYGKDAR